jgi:hypothetical protein
MGLMRAELWIERVCKTVKDASRLETVPPRKLKGRIAAVLTTAAKGRMGFLSQVSACLEVDLEGISGNRHRGWTRRADARAPYLRRGTVMRNDRHVSIVSVEELAEIARRLDIPALDPAWIGANVVVSGIPRLSYLPRGAHLFSTGGAILTVTDQNAPCTLAGEGISRHVADRPEIKLLFPTVAQGLRGVVAAVEHPGTLEADTALDVRLPAQWIYR